MKSAENLLTGPRQAGKTTILQKLAQTESRGRRYVTLDDLTERDLAKNDPALFLQLHKPPVLIDEAQYAPELFTCIKIHIDEHHNPGDFWMTGSQIFRLMRGVQESLAGRVALLHMCPCHSGRSSAPLVCRLQQIWIVCLSSGIRSSPSPRRRCSNACGAVPCRGSAADRRRIEMCSIHPISPLMWNGMSGNSPAAWTH